MSRTAFNARNRLLGLALIVSLAVATALAQDAINRDASGVNLATGEAGTYLVDAAGMALYLFVPDAQGASTCYDDCATSWPPVVITSADLPTAGEGVDASLLGTTARDDGSMQLTYNGWPLYYFASDTVAGFTNGQGMGSNWFLVSDVGEAIGAAE